MNIRLLVLLLLIGCKAQIQAEPAICQQPYIEWKAGECCLDTNNNYICDEHEITEAVLEQRPMQEIQERQLTIVEELLQYVPKEYAFHNFKTGIVINFGDRRRAFMDPVETRSTSLYWDLANKKGWTVCDSDVEAQQLGERYSTDVARCTPGQVDVRELTKTEYEQSLDIADGPVDWMMRYKDRMPYKIDLQTQQLGTRSITPVAYYNEPDGSITILKFDQYYRVPIRIEKISNINGAIDKKITNYEYYREYRNGPITENLVIPPKPEVKEEQNYELKLTHIYPTSDRNLRIRGYLSNKAEIKTGSTRVRIECVNKYGDVIGADYVFVGTIQPDRTESFETDIEMNVEDLKDCSAKAEEYVWTWD